MTSIHPQTNRFFFIITITVICGLAAGAVAFYRQQQTNPTVSADIISTIVPTEQEKPSAMSVTIDSLQYNQTLADLLNTIKISADSPIAKVGIRSMFWQADLNSAVLHSQAQINDQADAGLAPTNLVNIAEENASILNIKQYNNKITSKFFLLSSSQPSSLSLPSNPYLITFLGLLVGFFISTIFLKANSD